MTENDARGDAGELANKIFDSLFPHRGNLPPKSRRYRRNGVPEELRARPLADDEPVAKGDVLIVWERDRQYWDDGLRGLTVREAVHSGQSRLVIVESGTAKTFTVRDLPSYIGASTDLSDLDALPPADYTERIRRTGKYREVGYIGTVAGFQEKINTHPDFATWQAAHTAYLEEEERKQRERATKIDRQEKDAVPFAEAAERLNAVLGAEAVEVTPLPLYGARTRFTDGWKFLGDLELLAADAPKGQVYLHGLAALSTPEKLPPEVLSQALADLELLAADAQRRT
jgi:hypothetical protein